MEVRDNRDENRYEILVDGQVGGYTEYRLSGLSIVFFHTEIDPDYRGQGLAGTLVRSALDDVRDSSKRRVVARCHLVRGWIERHPEYKALMERPAGPFDEAD